MANGTSDWLRMLRFDWSWRLSAPVERVWPCVSDLQWVDAEAGLPSVAFCSVPSTKGGSTLHGSARQLGLALEWEERPFDWVAPRQFRLERCYTRGPVRRLVNEVRLEVDGAGTRLFHSIHAEPRAWWWLPVVAIEVGVRVRAGFSRAYMAIERQLQANGRVVERAVRRLSAAQEARLDAVAAALAATHEPRLVAALASLIRTGGDRALARIRPYPLARDWQAGRHQVLDLLLRAAHLGALRLSWDSICPSCRSPAVRVERLAEVRPQVHCEMCNIDFGADFSRSIELTFRVAPYVRDLELADFCTANPQTAPHVLLQRCVAPGATIVEQVRLQAGSFRLGSLQLADQLSIDVRDGGADETVVAVAFSSEPGGATAVKDAQPRLEVAAGAPITLRLDNPATHPVTFKLEDMRWVSDAATAAEVSTLQSFRGLFDREALSPGTSLQVARVALLFTDLAGSTRLYQTLGDAAAYGMVRRHFEVAESVVARCNGAIVKTIGDAVMAAFCDPVDAVAAAVELGERVRDVVRSDGSIDETRLAMKVGVHLGACLAVESNGHLDYFGNTVNIAARLQEGAGPNELVLTQSVAAEPSVSTWLAHRDLPRRTDALSLKGILAPVAVVRVPLGSAESR